ncbi:MAG: hypothetical protein ACXV2C_04395 [Candidatus Bathyarchaeia archaeon]
MFKPYTYLIGWSHLDKWYYGVRYRKGCHPGDLWKPYRTSSKIVKQFIRDHGEPDVIEVRRTFVDKKAATIWEHKVLKRLKVNITDKWLNKTYNGCFIFRRGPQNTEKNREAAYAVTRGKTYEEIYDDPKEIERLKKRSGDVFRAIWSDPERSKKMSKKPEDTSAYSRAAKARWSNPEDRAKRCAAMKGKKKVKA